jgi:hypothetical protein
MRKSTKILGALAVAGLIIAGGTVFTEANTVPTSTAGYGTSTVTGVTVTNVKYNVHATNANLLDSIVFTETEDVSLPTHYKGILTIDGPLTTQIVCDLSVANAITCLTPTQVIGAITSVALTVVSQ